MNLHIKENKMSSFSPSPPSHTLKNDDLSATIHCHQLHFEKAFTDL